MTAEPPQQTGRVRQAPPAVLLVLAGVVSVQVGAGVAKSLFPELGPVGTVFVRLLVAALVLCAVARPRPSQLTLGRWRPAVAFGLVLGAMNLTFYLALDRIPLGVAVTVEFLGPLAVAVAGSRRLRELVWAALAALGVVLLTDGGSAVFGGRLDAVGLLLAAVAGACWAGYILLSQRVGAALPGMSGLAVALVVGAALTAPWGIVQGGADLLRPELLLAGVGVGLLSSALPYALELAALRRLRAATFGVLMSTEPAVAALVGFLVLSERLTPVEGIAIAMVCLASAGATVTARRSPVPLEPPGLPEPAAREAS